jgi:hypothetical protein
MKPLPYNSDLLQVAPRVIWFEPAKAALADPVLAERARRPAAFAG